MNYSKCARSFFVVYSTTLGRIAKTLSTSDHTTHAYVYMTLSWERERMLSECSNLSRVEMAIKAPTHSLKGAETHVKSMV